MGLMDDILKKSRWPDRKQSLFSERKDWWNNARLDISRVDEGYAIYSEAYKDAADRLVEYSKVNKTSINFLVFPILFLYRHYIELALKEIILTASVFLEKDNKIMAGHNISRLWVESKKLISEIELDIPQQEINVLDFQIYQFHDLDKCSMTFRYPTDKSGNVYVNLSDSININNVQEIIAAMHCWFFGLVCVIGEYQDAKNQ